MKHLTVLLLFLLTVLFSAIASGKEKTGMEKLTITSTAFANDAAIPEYYTCDGSDAIPPLTIGNVPAGTRSLALIADDPDAPGGTWVHWVVWNIPAQTRIIPVNTVPDTAIEGRNSWGRNTYGGPCPPSGTHRYFFKLYALDTDLKLGASTDKAGLEKAMLGHILAKGELMGTYRRR
jgi:Raf kinase inhibitor-like YbhB/YbcL family protein